MARSQPPGKILASCQDLALLGKNLAQELFAGHVELAVSRLAVRCGKEKREVCVVWTCCAYELAS